MSREPAPPEARWFARLLRAYPAAFRARFGEGMHYAFLQDLEAARRTGRRAVVRLWLETLRSTATLTFRRLSDDIDASLAQERLVAVLSGFFSALAPLLAGFGL